MDSEIILQFEKHTFTVHASSPDDALARIADTQRLVSVRIKTAKWEPIRELDKTFKIEEPA